MLYGLTVDTVIIEMLAVMSKAFSKNTLDIQARILHNPPALPVHTWRGSFQVSIYLTDSSWQS